MKVERKVSRKGWESGRISNAIWTYKSRKVARNTVQCTSHLNQCSLVLVVVSGEAEKQTAALSPLYSCLLLQGGLRFLLLPRGVFSSLVTVGPPWLNHSFLYPTNQRIEPFSKKASTSGLLQIFYSDGECLEF